VRAILTATSRAGGDLDAWIDNEEALLLSARDGFDAPYADRPTLDLFWRREVANKDYPVEEIAERVASNFLGVRINCARCHKHPFDVWTQDDYRSFVAIFAHVRFDMSPELRASFADRLDRRRAQLEAGQTVGPAMLRVREVYIANDQRHGNDQAANKPHPPKALGGPVLLASTNRPDQSDLEPFDARVGLVDWLCEPQNPYFARNIVNRIWAYNFGRGLVEPLDALSKSHPPSNPQLFDALVADFIEHEYDIRRLERLILNSTAWQLSSEPNASNVHDQHHFARAYTRIPTAEAVIDIWHDAAGVSVNYGDGVPNNIRAVELGPNALADTRWNRLFKLFGRSSRTLTCDCEPPAGPSIRQTLALMSEQGLMADLSNGRLKPLLETNLTDDDVLDELFLSTVSRLPTEDERALALESQPAPAERLPFFEDVLWGLMNTKEFVTNH
jgi:hypothetical protein